MMGKRAGVQAALFYEFDLDRHMPGDHLLRSIDRFVDLSGIRAQLQPFYSAIGRPSIDPELMIRILTIGYCCGIRSARRLCEEVVHLNLAYRWFCGLGLKSGVPDHSTFSKNRHGRFRDSDLFRHLFESVLARCIAEGLVGGERFGADASIIRADASPHNKIAFSDWSVPEEVTRATREYLDTLDDAAFGAWPAILRGQTPMSSQAGRARRSRCCLPISSASCGSIACACADQTAPAMSSTSPQPPRTCGNLQSSSRCRLQEPPERYRIRRSPNLPAKTPPLPKPTF
jgi:transposase